MTIAIDKRTGAVVGQVIGPALIGEETRRLYGTPEKIRLFTRHGYVDVLRDTVRLEEVR